MTGIDQKKTGNADLETELHSRFFCNSVGTKIPVPEYGLNWKLKKILRSKQGERIVGEAL